MSDKLLTSGQASGATQLSLKTIRRYVSTYRPYFSPAARIMTRGRRFTPGDIHKLVTIHQLYQRHYPAKQIHAALAGEWSPDDLPSFTTEQVTQLVSNAQELLSQAIQLDRQTRQTLSLVEVNNREAIVELKRANRELLTVKAMRADIQLINRKVLELLDRH